MPRTHPSRTGPRSRDRGSERTLVILRAPSLRATPTVAERQSAMIEPAMLADHIDEQTETILAVWRATVEREGDVPEAERLSHREFVDHVPALLDRVAERLRGQPGGALSEGKEHGKHRWRQGYDIGAIIN